MLVARSYSDAFKGSVALLSEKHRTHLQNMMRNSMQYTTSNLSQEQGPGPGLGPVPGLGPGQSRGSHVTSINDNIINTKISTNDYNVDINSTSINLNMGPISGMGAVANSNLAGDINNNIQLSVPSSLSPPNIQTSGLKFDMSKFKSSASASAAVLKPLGTFTRRTIVRESSETLSGKFDENGVESEVQNGGRQDGEEGNDGEEKEGESRDGYNTNISNGEDSP